MPRCEDEIIPFGKHKGERLGDIIDHDPRYLDWLNSQEFSKPSLRDALKEICEKYPEKISAAIDD